MEHSPQTLVRNLPDTAQLRPGELAASVVEAYGGDSAWLDAFAASLDERRAAGSLARVLGLWALSQADAARLFGVSRQAVGKWLDSGPPAERRPAIAALAAASDLLVRYLKRDRIPAVVRKSIPARGGANLLELLERDGADAVLDTCRAMFEFPDATGA